MIAVRDDAFTVDRSAVDWPIAIAGMLSVAIPLSAGLAVGEPQYGLIGALGGLNLALVVPARERANRWQWGLLVVIGAAVALILGHFAGPSIAASAVVTFVWLAFWSTLRVAGLIGMLAGFVVSVMFIIISGLPEQPVGQQLLLFLAGALLGLALMLAAGALPGKRQEDDQQAWPGLRALIAKVAAGLREQPIVRHHALRLGLAAAATVLLYQVLEIPFGYWIPLSVLAILQPRQHQSNVRALQRASGTLIGVLIVAGLVVLTSSPWLLAAGASITALALFAMRSRSYHWMVILLTPTALLMISIINYQGWKIAEYRVVDTAIGITVGLLATWLLWRGDAKAPPRR